MFESSNLASTATVTRNRKASREADFMVGISSAKWMRSDPRELLL